VTPGRLRADTDSKTGDAWEATSRHRFKDR
jgi:hypothetical protein